MTYLGYELWDLETGNAVEGFESEQEALLAVLDALVRHGRQRVEPWALAEVTDNATTDLGIGQKLVDRALAMVVQAAAAVPSTTGSSGYFVAQSSRPTCPETDKPADCYVV
jgi:hypothetical protein